MSWGAWSSLLSSLTIPQGATAPTPRIVLDGVTGKITVYGLFDRIIEIDPNGPDGPQISFADTGVGYLIADIFGVQMITAPYVDQYDGDEVQAKVAVAEGGVTIGMTRTVGGSDGGRVTVLDAQTEVAYYRAGTKMQSIVLNVADGIVIDAGVNAPGASSIDLLGEVTITGSGMTNIEAFETANDTYNVNTSYTPGTTHGSAFVAPPSGAVMVSFGGWLGLQTGTLGRRAFMSCEVRAGAVVGAGAIQTATNDDAAILTESQTTAVGFHYQHGWMQRRITGLTPGSTYNVRTMFRFNTAGDSVAVNDRRMYIDPILVGVS